LVMEGSRAYICRSQTMYAGQILYSPRIVRILCCAYCLRATISFDYSSGGFVSPLMDFMGISNDGVVNILI